MDEKQLLLEAALERLSKKEAHRLKRDLTLVLDYDEDPATLQKVAMVFASAGYRNSGLQAITNLYDATGADEFTPEVQEQILQRIKSNPLGFIEQVVAIAQRRNPQAFINQAREHHDDPSPRTSPDEIKLDVAPRDRRDLAHLLQQVLDGKAISNTHPAYSHLRSLMNQLAR